MEKKTKKQKKISQESGVTLKGWDQQNKERKKRWKKIAIRLGETYKVKILFQLGVNVLYSVWVCNLALISSSTTNGSDLPPISAAARPVAPNTLTVRWPTSRSVCSEWCHAWKKGGEEARKMGSISLEFFRNRKSFDEFLAICVISLLLMLFSYVRANLYEINLFWFF